MTSRRLQRIPAMRPVSRGFWTIWAALSIATLGFASMAAEPGRSRPAIPQAGASCTCGDLPYLMHRLNQDNAALDAIAEYEKTVKTNGPVSDPAPAPNPKRLTHEEAVIQAMTDAMAAVDPGGVRQSSCYAFNNSPVEGRDLKQF